MSYPHDCEMSCLQSERTNYFDQTIDQNLMFGQKKKSLASGFESGDPSPFSARLRNTRYRANCLAKVAS